MEITKLLDELLDVEITDSNYEYDGNKVPRTTHILSRCIHADQLLYWANSLGFKHQSYNKTMMVYSTIGTQCHDNIDKFLINHNHIPPINMEREARIAYDGFLKWWEAIHLYANSVEVVYHEKPITCKYFGGTLDGLYKINGKLYLIDYKTSNHITFRYVLQLAAYRYILREEYNINIDGCIILQLSKKNVGFNEYTLNFDNKNDLNYMNECERAFLSLVYSYYNLLVVEEGYNGLNWR